MAAWRPDSRFVVAVVGCCSHSFDFGGITEIGFGVSARLRASALAVASFARCASIAWVFASCGFAGSAGFADSGFLRGVMVMGIGVAGVIANSRRDGGVLELATRGGVDGEIPRAPVGLARGAGFAIDGIAIVRGNRAGGGGAARVTSV